MLMLTKTFFIIYADKQLFNLKTRYWWNFNKLENNRWDIDVSNTRNNTLATITCLNKKVAESEYSSDLYYLDDTMCTNIYGRPVHLANIALSRIEKEYNAFIKGEQNNHCFLKTIALSLPLLCHHDMVLLL